ncbi:mitochondrial threonine dehydratase (threonine ammonia-lyase) [Andalucia godoyi]|uniref:Mitochondrial threonine dehydratase (Threonine ammonia-lyase) n=1 Tax=Andalucia godoyi TaxID=505711 RepID=A0A8K0AJ51_ANDGO|nr:mitochondrial threonine dehydratase (threonine ammonia-lyase) [Andalucia godoyi]|eukprot:ANDGO_06150.mRNA.1 mitochondrial threonine dehydratase (threonine ammonia-lyase)
MHRFRALRAHGRQFYSTFPEKLAVNPHPSSSSTTPSTMNSMHPPSLAADQDDPLVPSLHSAYEEQSNGNGSSFSTGNPGSSSSSSSSGSGNQSSNGGVGTGTTAVRLPSFHDVVAARKRIAGRLRVTPLNYSHGLSKLTNNDVYIKLENNQVTGSYKERGALNNLLQLSPQEAKNGVVLASAGNHAQAVAFHAQALGIDAKIVMPTTTPIAKIVGTRRWGGTIILHGESFDDAAMEAQKISIAENRLYVHAFDRFNTIAGQGTLGLELFDQCPDLDAVVVPIGGGGVIAGVSMVLKELNPDIKVFGVEAENMASGFLSKKQHIVTEVPFRATIADGIAVRRVGNMVLPYLEKYVDDIALVNENEISLAVLRLLQYEKTVVEGSGSTTLAALLNKKLPLENKKVALICTGGNIDMTILGKIIERGLVQDGRLARIVVTMHDRPGSLAQVLSAIGKEKASVRQVEHERAFMDMKTPIGFVKTQIELETESFEHVERIIDSLKNCPPVVSIGLQDPTGTIRTQLD